LSRSWHFAFDTIFNDFGNPGIDFPRIIVARTFIAARVIPVAMRAIAV
jgi:hypothetical protein